MAYEAHRDDEIEAAEERAANDASNQKAVQGAAEVLSNVGGYAGAIGKGVKYADTATGGLVSDIGGRALNQANKLAPGGKTAQGLTNAVANSGLADAALDAYKLKNGNAGDAADNVADGAEKAKDGAEKAADGAEKAKDGADKVAGAQGKKEPTNQVKKGGEQDDSLPSSGGAEADSDEPQASKVPVSDRGIIDDVEDKVDSVTDVASPIIKTGILSSVVGPIMIVLAPIAIIIGLILLICVTVYTNLADYEDAFGISEYAGLETGGMDGTVSDPDQVKFYERIVEVKNDFQKDGKTVDPLKIIAVYHALNTYDANVSYKEMTKTKITQIANAMFDGNTYSEEAFRRNLKLNVIPTYLFFSTSSTKDAIIEEVFSFINNYYDLIGVDSSSCSEGSCTYNIKGFYISGSNYKKEMTVNNLYVRLMQCGSYNGHNAGGTWGYPLEDEELIPFEKYILGVAYQEIGPNAPAEAFKAQMVAARSYILARPTQMSSSTSWRKLEKEDGKWVLQVAACTADQVYCDPDKGCSAENGDAQWKQVHSGTNHGRTIKGPLAADSPARTYANQVQGETLVNNQGYIILTNYESNTTDSFSSYANSGYDYKQILMQVYSSGNDINKANCGNCVKNTGYASWRQDEGEWVNISLGNSSNTIKSAGCLVTSLAIQIAKSGVPTNISNFNPGTFVTSLNNNGAFDEYGNLISYSSVDSVAPSFKYQNVVDVSSMDRQSKLETIKGIVNQQGVYAVAEVGASQHWVAIDSVNGDSIKMMDPGSDATDMWSQYNWANTSRIVYYKVG